MPAPYNLDLVESYEEGAHFLGTRARKMYVWGLAPALALGVFWALLTLDKSEISYRSILSSQFAITTSYDFVNTFPEASIEVDKKEEHYRFFFSPQEDEIVCLNNTASRRQEVEFIMAKAPLFWTEGDSGVHRGQLSIAGWKCPVCPHEPSRMLRLTNDFERFGPAALVVLALFLITGLPATLTGALLKITQFRDVARLLHTTGLFLASTCYFTVPSILLLLVLCPLTIALS